MTETSTGTNVLITDEMVETAAAAIWNRSAREIDGCPLWDGRLPSNIRHSIRRDARAALEAAAPQIAAQALREAADWLDAVRADLDAVSRLGNELKERVSSQSGRSVVTISSDLSDAHDALDSTAPDRLDRMERALRGVMEAHALFRIYELEADGTPRCWNGVESVLATCCESCTPDDTIEAAGTSEWTEDMPYVPWPCPTVATIWEALSDEWV